MTQAFGRRSYGPFLLVPVLIEISPLGGIPGSPTILAAIIILFAAHLVFGRKHIWLPQFLSGREVSSGKLEKATHKLQPVARFADRWFHGRLPALASGPFVQFAAICTILLCLSVPPLEVLPFASTAPMAAIAAFGLALLARDGLLIILAFMLVDEFEHKLSSRGLVDVSGGIFHTVVRLMLQKIGHIPRSGETSSMMAGRSRLSTWMAAASAKSWSGRGSSLLMRMPHDQTAVAEWSSACRYLD